MSATTSSTVSVLQVTCGHCGHVREFERDGRLTVDHLEDLSTWRCTQCSARGGSVFAFLSYPISTQRTLERLPGLPHTLQDTLQAERT
jgi:hypothetical protein